MKNRRQTIQMSFCGAEPIHFSKVWWNTLSPRQLSATNCNQSITFIRLQVPGTWVGDAEEVIGAAMVQGLSWTKPMKSAPLSRSLQGTSLSSECYKDGWHLKADFHFIFLKSLKDAHERPETHNKIGDKWVSPLHLSPHATILCPITFQGTREV